ncbi:MAG: hypothetical protein IJI37_00870 [Opitutales bacterium]|nr:hypothetical protein [Opitutales bacterium]
MRKICTKRAFTLLEAILALALFAACAAAISRVCYNCLYSLDVSDKTPMADIADDQLDAALLTIADYDSLDSGVDVETPDGETYTVKGEAEPTQILNLFKLEISVQSGTRETKRRMFVVRPNSWYEQPNERADMLRDRKDFLEEKRRQWSPEQEKNSEEKK